jgi:hypothetical protein
MSAPPYDAEYEAHLRQVIREELEADRKARSGWFWWAASLIVFGPFALAAAALVLLATAITHFGAKAIWAIRRRRADTLEDA